MVLLSKGGASFSSPSITTQAILTESTTTEPLNAGNFNKNMTSQNTTKLFFIHFNSIATNIRMIKNIQNAFV